MNVNVASISEHTGCPRPPGPRCASSQSRVSRLAPGWSPPTTCVLIASAPVRPRRPEAVEALTTLINYRVSGLVHWTRLM